MLRPTRRSRASADAAADSGDPSAGLYTQGTQAVESRSAEGLDEAAAAEVIELAVRPGGSLLLVGSGWPKGTRRMALPAFLAAPVPGQAPKHGHEQDCTMVNLYPGFGSVLFRVLLAAGTARVAVVCRNDVPELRDAAGQAELAQLPSGSNTG